MAHCQPEDEAEISAYNVRDDHQPWVDDRDIDKSHGITGVPPQLDDVVDRAVAAAKRYVSLPDVRRRIVRHIEDFLYPGQPEYRRPDEEWRSEIERLINETRHFYYQLLGHCDEFKEKVTHVLEQVGMKVKSMEIGCLIASLLLRDDRQLSRLVSELGNIAKELRAQLIKFPALESRVTQGLSLQKDSTDEVKKFALELVKALNETVRIQLSLECQPMLNFLKNHSLAVDLTILVTRPVQIPADEEAEIKAESFVEAFESYEHTYTALKESFRPISSGHKADPAESMLGELSLEAKESQEEEMKSDISAGASGKDQPQGAKGHDPSSLGPPRHGHKPLSQAMKDIPTEPREAWPLSDVKVFIRDLPPETSLTDLFEICRRFGTILNVEFKQDVETRALRHGCVEFAEPSSAEQAIKKLTDCSASKAKIYSEAREMGTTTLMIRDLGDTMTRQQLMGMCGGFGYIVRLNQYQNKWFVEFSSGSDARNALDSLQSQGKFAVMAYKY